ncbi:MAG: uracil-DNA glycosylase [Nitrospinota bacterium]|nr:MAG: uracil-DNA glycosylase [Nitrospinota bacterium]
MHQKEDPLTALQSLQEQIICCQKCPRLVAYRSQVAREKRRMYRDWEYWGRPLPGWGDPQARVLVVGLAPAAHGGNRTGRMFTGDRSAEWLLRTLHRFGFASQPVSVHREDGLTLRDLYITAALRCAPPLNKPLPAELASCHPYLVQEFTLLPNIRIVVALGHIAFQATLRLCRALAIPLSRPLPRFAHGQTYHLQEGLTLIASYHPSQQNTQTGRLTEPMFDKVFAEARRLMESGERL